MRKRSVLFVTALLEGCGAPPAHVGDVGEVSEGLKVCAKGSTVPGVDVSHYEGTIDWPSVKKGGIGFAIIKATENVNFIDPKFASNWSAAGQNGIVRGAYHFFRASVSPVAQADYFLQTAGLPAPGDLPPTLDFEVTDGLSGAQAAQAALVFLQRVEQKTGRTPMLYTGPSFFTNTLGNPAGFDRYVLWIANWQVTCPNIPSPPWTDWTFWQYSDSGTVPGILGTVDVDEFNGSLDDLKRFAGGPQKQVDAGTGDGAPDTAPDLATAPRDAALPSPDAGAPPDQATAEDLAPAGSQGGGTPRGCSCSLARRASRDPSAIALFSMVLFASLLRGCSRRRS